MKGVGLDCFEVRGVEELHSAGPHELPFSCSAGLPAWRRKARAVYSNCFRAVSYCEEDGFLYAYRFAAVNQLFPLEGRPVYSFFNSADVEAYRGCLTLLLYGLPPF